MYEHCTVSILDKIKEKTSINFESLMVIKDNSSESMTTALTSFIRTLASIGHGYEKVRIYDFHEAFWAIDIALYLPLSESVQMLFRTTKHLDMRFALDADNKSTEHVSTVRSNMRSFLLLLTAVTTLHLTFNSREVNNYSIDQFRRMVVPVTVVDVLSGLRFPKLDTVRILHV